jgi:hypothetical protein
MIRITTLLVSIASCISLHAQNVGIGTTAPRFPMSFPASNGQKISVYDDGNPAGLNFGIGMFSHQTMQIHSATSGDDIAFGYGSATNFMELLRIKGNGNVGINNTNPSEKLDVNGNINITGTIKVNGTDGAANQVLMKNSTGNLAWGSASKYNNMRLYQTNATFVIPAGVTSILIEMWGAGGGGSSGGGGGSGSYLIGELAVTPGQFLDIQIGAGGRCGALSTSGVAENGGFTSILLGGTQQVLLWGGGGATATQPGFGAGASAAFNGSVFLYGESGMTTEESYQQSNATTFLKATRFGRGGIPPHCIYSSENYHGYELRDIGTNIILKTIFGSAVAFGGGGCGLNHVNATPAPSGANGAVLLRW